LSVEINESDKQNSDINIPKKGLSERIRSKLRLWKANFVKMSSSHKFMLIGMIILIGGLASVALIYGYIIVTTPGHKEIDTSFRLLKVENAKGLSFLSELPPPPEIRDQENPINGELYTKKEFAELKKRRPLFVIIENHTDARPQAGLLDADLVYETLAESGITRFAAVFWGKEAKKVGPIRSLRTYFLDWSSEYDDPPVCNIGQAGYEPWEEVIDPEADARSYIQKYNIKSYSWYGRDVFWRDQDKFNKGIAWEHVAYSETETLWADAETLGWVGPSSLESLKFKKDASKDSRSLTQEISIEFLSLGSESYKVKWVYERDSNSYLRYLAGKPHIDDNYNRQISVKTIIIQHVPYRPTGDKNGRIVFTTVGTGDADIFLDSKQMKGIWKKESRTARTKFYDESGKEIPINRGLIWIEVVPVSGDFDLSKIVIK
ncbi:MAG: DUF3048 domain-containing protein, partial [Candidatus Dojkabacteria bacterium]|nr:DUF3048 domain-containing protein [Candidatus Dojkabacteria bacterium]